MDFMCFSSCSHSDSNYISGKGSASSRRKNDYKSASSAELVPRRTNLAQL